jgi:hypothetical protein
MKERKKWVKTTFSNEPFRAAVNASGAPVCDRIQSQKTIDFAGVKQTHVPLFWDHHGTVASVSRGTKRRVFYF